MTALSYILFSFFRNLFLLQIQSTSSTRDYFPIIKILIIIKDK